MKISIVIQGLGIKSGGPSRSVVALAEGLKNAGIEVDILTTDCIDNPNILTAEWVKCARLDKVGAFGYVRGFIELLKNSEGSLFHIQGMFSYIPMVTPFIARKLHKPYIIAPRGMMYANALRMSAIRKALFRKMFINRDLNKAVCLQATCLEELQEIRKAGITSPIAIIPNSLTIPETLPIIATSKKFRIGFVGRINVIKNIDGLMRAWKIAGMEQREDAELLIIGGANLDSEKQYQQELFKLEKELGINNICWAGMKTGMEKENLLRTCTIAILPSHSENFGMMVPEALMNGIPVIASDKTPWKMLEKYNCGWSIQNSPESMAKVIIKASNVSIEERKQMGLNGQKMVVENFSTEKISEKLIALYKWVLNEGEKPDFVFMQ